MGNDLTGWEWLPNSGRRTIYFEEETKVGVVRKYGTIPHYSTTWEGAELVMEELKRRDFDITIELLGDKASVQIGSRRPILGTTLPQALCKAYISAMEEREWITD
jgi:hypothetical protein